MEATATKLASLSTGLLFASLPKSLGTAVAYSSTPLNRLAHAYFFRLDKDSPQQIVNIFDGEGNLAYTLHRLAGGSTCWVMFAEPSHLSVATVKIGFLSRQIETSEGSVRLHPASGVRGKMHRHFYDADCQLYAWNRRSHYLERISAQNAHHAEHREVLGMAKQLRTNRFDWEVVLDEKAMQALDPSVLLASAFLNIKTQWAFPRSTTRGRVGISSFKSKNDPLSFDESLDDLSLADNPSTTVLEAADFVLSSPTELGATQSRPTQSRPTQSRPTQSKPAQLGPTQLRSTPVSPPVSPLISTPGSTIGSTIGSVPTPFLPYIPGFVNNDMQKLAVFTAPEPSDSPREFFNPPPFMKSMVALPK